MGRAQAPANPRGCTFKEQERVWNAPAREGAQAGSQRTGGLTSQGPSNEANSRVTHISTLLASSVARHKGVPLPHSLRPALTR